MKCAIIGRTFKLYKTAEALLEAGHKIAAVVTAKAAPEYPVSASDFEELAHNSGARFLQTARIDKHPDTLLEYGSLDVGISVNYPGIIPQSVIDSFRLGILNAHGGDLPRYRGNACQAWAILNGEDQIGLCIHKMVGGELDSGDIIERDYFPLSIDSRIGEVHEWMNQRVPDMFLSAVGKLSAEPAYILERQSRDPADALRCYPRCPSDARIDWTRSNREILRLINASSEPYAGAFGVFRGKNIIVWRAHLPAHDVENCCAVPGQVARIDSESGDVTIITGAGKLVITDIEYEGKKAKPSAFVSSMRDRLE